MLRTLWSFLRRDAAIQTSYKLGFTLDMIGVFNAVVTYYFMARAFGSAVSPLLAPYGGDYFSFIIVGISFTRYQDVGLNSFSQAIRQEQFLNTLEPLLMTPVRIPVFLLGSALWDFIRATLEVLLYLLMGYLFGLKAARADLPAAAVVLCLTLFVFMGMGIFAAAFIMRFKRGNPVTWFLTSVSVLLGGVYFPQEVLPQGLKTLSKLVPMTYALAGLRKTLLTGAGFGEVLPEMAALAAFIAVIWPAGVLCFSWSIRKAQEDGTLGHY